MAKTIELPGDFQLIIHGDVHAFDDVAKFNPNQPRGQDGRWAKGGGSSRDIASRTMAEGGSTTDVFHDTLSPAGPITSGMAVSAHPERSTVVENPNRATATTAIAEYRARNADLLHQPGNALGTWLDTETNQLWLDVVTVVNTREQATSIARAANQIAFFDLGAGEEVRTGGTGEDLAKRDRRLLQRVTDLLRDAGVLPPRGEGVGGSDPERGHRGQPVPGVDYRRGDRRPDWLRGDVEKFNPNQQRDAKGRWSKGGGSTAGDVGGRGPGGHDLSDKQRESMTLDEQIAWATDPSRTYPIGHVIGGDTRSGDFRVEHDPDRRFTELYQRTFNGYGTMRATTQAVLEGRDPDVAARENLEIDDIELGGVDGSLYAVNTSHSLGYQRRDMVRDMVSGARWMADGIRGARPAGRPLHRGSTWPGFGNPPKAGDEVDLGGPTSTSPERQVAERYAQDIGGTFAFYTFSPNTRAFDLSPHSDWGKDAPETIVAGKFKITSVRESTFGFRDYPSYEIELEPIEQP